LPAAIGARQDLDERAELDDATPPCPGSLLSSGVAVSSSMIAIALRSADSSTEEGHGTTFRITLPPAPA
jgi:signal transduction histidine kinase